jgi:hypothetical protein
MSREFSLVLLGAGLLTAGSFFVGDDDVEALANEHAERQVASADGGPTTRRTRVGPMFIYLHTTRSGFGSSPTRAPVTRGGFGGVGRSFTPVS